jgi:hypothetical protein
VTLRSTLVLARWIPCLAYGDIGLHLRGSHRLTMLLAFLVLAAVQSAADLRAWWDCQAAAALLYLLVRAHRPVRALLGPVRR